MSMQLANSAVCIVAGLLLASCSFTPEIPAAGDLRGHHIETTVDSDVARYYLESYLEGKDADHDLNDKIIALYGQYDRSMPSREDLKKISHVFSVDFASLFFADRLLADECNRALNQSFLGFIDGRTAIDASIVSSYVVLFVPGWDYANNGHVTGADFARPRQLASGFGLENYLVEVPPTGSVEQNANVLATEIARHSRSGKKLVVAGASSAGPAIHLALGELLDDQELSTIRAWLNLGGILQGSPLIDYIEAKPWLFNLLIWFKGWDREAILSMGTSQSRKRFARLRLDSNILAVNYLGIPLSGQLSRYSRDKYPKLKSDGPNDGLTMLSDAIVPGSLTIAAIGSDHFFAEDPRIDEKTVALMKLILTHLENDITSGSSRCPRLRPGHG